MKNAGFSADSYSEVVTPTYAIIAYLKSINFDKSIFALATLEFKEALRQNGFTLIPEPVSYVNNVILVGF